MLYPVRCTVSVIFPDGVRKHLNNFLVIMSISYMEFLFSYLLLPLLSLHFMIFQLISLPILVYVSLTYFFTGFRIRVERRSGPEATTFCLEQVEEEAAFARETFSLDSSLFS